MQGPRIVVVSDSRPIRESLRLLLQDDYDVVPLSVAEARIGSAVLQSARLLIHDPAGGALLATLAAGNRLLTAPRLPIAGTDSPGGAPPFQPGELLGQIARLLSPGNTAAFPDGPDALRYPLLPDSVARLAIRAARTDFPILITGEPGSGKSRLARALHSFLGGRFVTIPAEQADPTTLAAVLNEGVTGPSTSLYIEDVADVPPRHRRWLTDLIEAGGAQAATGWCVVRVIAASTRRVDRLRAELAAEPGLFHRLTALTLHLPPLRERIADLPAIAAHLAARMSRGRDAIRFTPAALARMQDYLWFGNLAELEAVMARTLTNAESALIDADDIAFRIERPPSPSLIEAATPPGERPIAPPSPIELIITELAHEFKNPMVVIKTVAQQLERLAADESARREMAQMTGEAVDRMDRALENLLQFTQFEEPARQSVPWNELLTSCLSTLNPEFGERKIMLDYHAPDRQKVSVDVLQIAYALENLLRVVLRDLAPGARLTIRPLISHYGISIEFSPGSRAVSRQLADLGGANEAAPQMSSLGFWLARALIERNGGALQASVDGDKVTVHIELPEAGDGVEGHEEATRFDS